MNINLPIELLIALAAILPYIPVWGVNRLNTTAVITPSGRSSTLCSTFLMGMLVLAFSGHGIWATLSGACAMRTKQEGIVAPALLAGVAFVLWVRL
jgi:hypothetical protein